MQLFFDTFLLDLCLIPTCLVIILIIQYIISFSYWKYRKVPYITPKLPFGSAALLPELNFNSAEWFAEIYKVARVLGKKYIGLFIFTKPILVVADPDMIETILVKDAKYFQDKLTLDKEFFSAHNFKERESILPSCLNGNMNIMFETMMKYCGDLESLIKTYIFQDEPLDMIDIFEKLRINNYVSSLKFRRSILNIDSTVFTTINYCLYELSKNNEVQTKLRDEIKTTLCKYNNKITYEAVTEMNFLDQAIFETLRKYPAVPLLKREFKENYTFPGTNVMIDKGMQLWIPILGLQNDIWFYPEPDLFNPNRFTKEEQLKRHPFTYLPFGNDSRMCSELKLGILQTKVPLIILLNMYAYSVDPAMKLPSKFVKTKTRSTSETKIYLQIKKMC